MIYLVYDRVTGVKKGVYKTRQIARKRADALDKQIGGYRHLIAEIIS